MRTEDITWSKFGGYVRCTAASPAQYGRVVYPLVCLVAGANSRIRCSVRASCSRAVAVSCSTFGWVECVMVRIVHSQQWMPFKLTRSVCFALNSRYVTSRRWRNWDLIEPRSAVSWLPLRFWDLAGHLLRCCEMRFHTSNRDIASHNVTPRHVASRYITARYVVPC